MGKIPLYTRNRLASEVTGAPDTDRSGEILAEGFSKGVSAIGSAMQQRQNKIDMAHTEIETNRLLAEYSADRYKYSETLRKASESNPEVYIDKARKQNDMLMKDYASRATTPQVKAMFESTASGYLATVYQNDQKWVSDTRLINDTRNILATGQQMSTNGATASTYKLFLDNMGALQGHIKSTSNSISPEGQKVLQTQAKAAVTGYIEPLLIIDPNRALAEINDSKSGLLALGLITPDDAAAFTKKAVDNIPKYQEAQMAIASARATGEMNGAYGAYRVDPDGASKAKRRSVELFARADAMDPKNPKLKYVRAQAEFYARISEAISRTKSSVAPSVSDRDVEGTFHNRLSAIRDKAKAKPNDVGFLYDDLLSVQADLAKAYSNRSLSEAGYTQLSSQVQANLAIAAGDPKTEGWGFGKSWSHALDSELKDYADRMPASRRQGKTRNDLRAAVAAEMFRIFSAKGVEDYKALSAQEINNTAEQAKKNYMMSVGVDVDMLRRRAEKGTLFDKYGNRVVEVDDYGTPKSVRTISGRKQ